METVYRHHSYFKTIGKKMPAIAAVFIFLCWLPTLLVYVFVYRDLYLPLIRLSLNGSMMVVFFALLTSILNRELQNTVYIVNNDGVIKKTPYKIKVAQFSGITRFRHVRFPLIKGYGQIEYSEGTIRLPFTIEKLPECIGDIEKRLETLGKQDVYDAENIRVFKQKALVSERTIDRISRAFPALSRISLGFMAGGWLVARDLWHLPLRWVILWALCGYIFPFSGFVLARWHIARGLERGMNKLDLSLPSSDEVKAYYLSGLGTFLAYLAAGIILRYMTAR
jgi:hypothetical protein